MQCTTDTLQLKAAPPRSVVKNPPAGDTGSTPIQEKSHTPQGNTALCTPTGPMP